MLLALLVLLFLTAPALWLLRPHNKSYAGVLATIPPGLVAAWLLAQIPTVGHGEAITQEINWVPSIGLDLLLRLDGLSLFFGLIVTVIGVGVAFYTHYYLEDDPRQGYFYLALFVFMGSMLGLVLADNVITLFVFWEGTSISSYLLIGYKYNSVEAKNGAKNALLVTGAGGLMMLAGLVILGQEAGTNTISQILAMDGLTESPLYPAAAILIMLGAFTKSAQFPFHFWLPGAMAAPTPASAYLHSATMVKAGIYLLARFHPALADSPLWFWSLFTVGGITMLIGAILALNNWDIKGLLAYATISQLGILTMLLAFNSEEALIAVAVGILAHALYKGPLFLMAGIIDHATGTRDLRRFGGMWRGLPWTATVGVLAGLSMAGIPPLFGFLAKETLLETLYHQIGHPGMGGAALGWIGFVAAGITGAFFVGYTLTLLWETFFRPNAAPSQEPAHVHHKPRFLFVLAPLALVLLGTTLPFLLGPLSLLLDPTASAIAGETVHTHLALWHGFTPVFITSLIAIGSGIVIFFARNPIRRVEALLPKRFQGVTLFGDLLDSLYALSHITTNFTQRRTLATQAGFFMLVAVTPLIAALLQLSPVDLLPSLSLDILPQEIILGILTVVAAISVVTAKERLGAIIAIGVVGVTVTLFFVFFSAPDLALTQLLIEVLTLVLLVLVFHKIPQDKTPEEKRPPVGNPRQAVLLITAAAAGLFGFGLVLFSGSPAMQVGDSISSFFMLNSVSEAHGGNVVNVILVDFRGFDTMGEITVLGIAALGGYALLTAPRSQSLAELAATVRQKLNSSASQETDAEADSAADSLAEGDPKPNS